MLLPFIKSLQVKYVARIVFINQMVYNMIKFIKTERGFWMKADINAINDLENYLKPFAREICTINKNLYEENQILDDIENYFTNFL